MKTLGSAYVNLLKTSIGSGVLNFPFLFKTYGICITIIFTLLTGIVASTGLYLLMICSQEIGRSADLGKLAILSIPYAKLLVDFAVFVKCFGVATSYMIIAGNLLSSVFKTFFDSSLLFYSPFCLGLFTCCIAPFCYFKKMDGLKYTSFIGLMAIIFVIIASIFRYSHDGSDPEAKYDYIKTNFSIYWLNGFGKFIFSFTCHQNIFYVYSELENNSLNRMKQLICITASSAFILYMLFGISNYLLYGNKVKDNVLMNYPEDHLTSIVHILYIIVMGVSYPLQLSPGKNYFINFIQYFIKIEKLQYNDTFNNLITSLLILMTYIIAVSGVGLGIIYAVVGATASTFMSLILPAIFYLHADIEKTLLLSIMSYISFLFGIFVFLTTLISLALKLPVH